VLFEGASYLPVTDRKALEEFHPTVLVGSAAHLLELAYECSREGTKFSELNSAVFVLTDFRDTPVTDGERTSLWKAFSVPVYELVLADDGALLASECEAQEGWHIEQGVRFSHVNDQLWFSRRGRQNGTGLVGEIADQPCPCGRPGQRILHAAIDFRDPVRQKLAYIA
jgi:hypothetical protein